MRHPGQCCEECVPSKGSCVHEGVTRHHDEMWNRTRCEFCTCDEGEVACWNGECAKVQCASVRKWLYFENNNPEGIVILCVGEPLTDLQRRGVI